MSVFINNFVFFLVWGHDIYRCHFLCLLWIFRAGVSFFLLNVLYPVGGTCYITECTTLFVTLVLLPTLLVVITILLHNQF
jgi:hypothetical protein